MAHRACGGSVACGDGICSVVRPPWGRRWMGAPFRGFASLTRGYRVVRPLWGRCLRDMQLTRVSLPHHAHAVPSWPSGRPHHAHAVSSWPGWSAAKRSNYSVTEGELSEPSDGCGMGVWAPRGSNARVWCIGVMRQYGDGRSVSLAVVRPPWGRRWMGVPFRGFASLTRGYRIVRPLRGRPPL